MTKAVKNEIFGTRKSLLKERLKNYTNLKIFEGIFFGTCLWRINPDPRSRYILFRECFSEDGVGDISFGEIIPFLKNFIGIYNIFVSKENEKIKIKNLRSGYEEIFYNKDNAAKSILGWVNCLKEELRPSTAKIKHIEEVSELSKFLRLNMYGRLGNTDIDFIILNQKRNTLILVEEKLFTEEKGGSIGKGQYISFRELLYDGLNFKNKSIKFYLLFISDEIKEESYYYDFLQEKARGQREASYYNSRRKEERVVFSFSEMDALKLDMFISKCLVKE